MKAPADERRGHLTERPVGAAAFSELVSVPSRTKAVTTSPKSLISAAIVSGRQQKLAIATRPPNDLHRIASDSS